jgi:2-keto-3-deoxy-L-rhamnonate aldolase RhmA
MTRYGPRARTRVRERLEREEVAVVVAGHAVSADTADFVGRFGFDGYWLEAEHGATAWDRVADISRACELWGMTAMMRVRRLDPSLVGRALTLGAGGIVIPQVRTASEAALLAEAGRFAPQGRRGVSMGRRSYGNADFFATESSGTVLVVQLEDTVALDNLDEIVAVDGIDVVFIAPNDLAQSMGHQGEPGHPEVQAAIADGLGRIAAAGRAAGTLCAMDRIEHFVGVGARFLYTSLDAWIAGGSARFLSAVAATAPRSDLA